MQPQRPLCDVPWLGISVVLSDGRINFCCFSDATVGNVNEESFEQIWNGKIMQNIRKSLSEQRLPSECQSASCPIYRGDDLNYIFNRMEGPSSFKTTGSHDPHAEARVRLQHSELQVNCNGLRTGDTLEVNLEFYYQGEPLVSDLFVGIRHPDGVIRFLPDFEDYAVPFKSFVRFSEDRVPLRFKVVEERIDCSQTEGKYEICAALFQHDSNPNLLSNCYWSSTKPFNITTGHFSSLSISDTSL
jgi:radical SAM protein with 4Fe4S-binding SPASM domain